MTDEIYYGLALVIGIGIAMGLYFHYKSQEHLAYERWKEQMRSLNPNLKFPDQPPWEHPSGQGPSAFTFYL